MPYDPGPWLGWACVTGFQTPWSRIREEYLDLASRYADTTTVTNTTTATTCSGNSGIAPPPPPDDEPVREVWVEVVSAGAALVAVLATAMEVVVLEMAFSWTLSCSPANAGTATSNDRVEKPWSENVTLYDPANSGTEKLPLTVGTGAPSTVTLAVLGATLPSTSPVELKSNMAYFELSIT